MTQDDEKARCLKAYRETFKDARMAEAPGRIEFLGNHLDYNGGQVLGAAIDGIVCALAMPREERKIRLFSETFEDAVVETSLDDLSKRVDDESWANYPLGILWALQEKGLAPSCGFNLVLTTDLPLSAGLSSSAAVVGDRLGPPATWPKHTRENRLGPSLSTGRERIRGSALRHTRPRGFRPWRRGSTRLDRLPEGKLFHFAFP